MTSESVKLFKALSDETRIEIVQYLLKHKELSCQEISEKFPLSQPALSHHYRKLLDANIIQVRKQGVTHFYSVNRKFLEKIGINIQKVISINT